MPEDLVVGQKYRVTNSAGQKGWGVWDGEDITGFAADLPETGPIEQQKGIDLGAINRTIREPGFKRGLGTTAGAAIGTALGGQSFLGGVAGGALTDALFTPRESKLGAIAGPITDSAIGSLLGKIMSLAGPTAGGIKAGIQNKLRGEPFDFRTEIIPRILASSENTLKPIQRMTSSPFDPNTIGTLEPTAKDIAARNVPVNLGELVNSPAMMEAASLAENAAKRWVQQSLWARKSARDIAIPNMSGPQKQKLMRFGPDATAEWVVQSNPVLRQTPNAISLVKSAPNSLEEFTALKNIVGTEKAHIVLFKDAFEGALDPKTGLWKSDKLWEYFNTHRDQFNELAKMWERQGGPKASDMKASWQRFIHENGLMAAGKAADLKGVEMALTNSGISAGIGIPLLGFNSYPAWRAIASGTRIMLGAPALGKVFSDPKAVNLFIKLTTTPASNPARANTFREFGKWAFKNGVRFTGTGGTEYLFNPNTNEPEEVN